MDDDLIFGASIWGASSDKAISPVSVEESLPTFTAAASPVATSPIAEQFDDFNDFGDPISTAEVREDDEFGDFGDFGESQGMAAPADFGEDAFGEVRIPGPSQSDWEPLRLDPLPSREEIASQVEGILSALWADEDLSQITTTEDIRQVEGLSQVLVAAESRDLYNTLFASPPPTKPPNWKRSRIRRQHLISLGIPVNLDEVLPHANGKPLPPLQITTRPMSAPPGPRNTPPLNGMPPVSASNSRSGTPRAGTPQPASRAGPSNAQQLSLGPKPQLDDAKINELLRIDPDTLPLLPIATLEGHLAELRAGTAKVSSLLTHLLQTREALQQDSETYNGLIAELVGEAQKINIGKGKQQMRRGSGIV